MIGFCLCLWCWIWRIQQLKTMEFLTISFRGSSNKTSISSLVLGGGGWMMFSHSSAAPHVGGGAKGNPGHRNILFCSLDLHIPDAGEPRAHDWPERWCFWTEVNLNSDWDGVEEGALLGDVYREGQAPPRRISGGVRLTAELVDERRVSLCAAPPLSFVWSEADFLRFSFVSGGRVFVVVFSGPPLVWLSANKARRPLAKCQGCADKEAAWDACHEWNCEN